MVTIPAGRESFVLHSDLRGLLVLQQAQGRPSEDAEVGIGSSFPGSAVVPAERHVELPVHRLDAPLTTYGRPERPRGQEVRMNVVGRFTTTDRVADRCGEVIRTGDDGADGDRDKVGE